MLQAYSAPPFNITSGVTTVQGTAGRPIVNGEFIERNAGEGTPFFNLNARISRSFHLGDRWQLEVLAEGFNLTESRQRRDAQHQFRRRRVSDESRTPTYNQITAVGEPRSFQFGARIRF